jgi:predicted DNA-binding protein (MmcQ/YjbR family)
VPARKKETLATLAEQLQQHALALPEAWLDHPWGSDVAKVGKKVFAFLPSAAETADGGLHLSVKLPETGPELLTFDFATPTGYGLGRGGWVTLRFDDARLVPVELCEDAIVESYRTIAPKKLAKLLDDPEN